MIKVRTAAGDTVGLLLFRHLGRDDDEVINACYNLNPGLAGHGASLPAGVEVLIPDPPAVALQKVQRAWD
uniref:Putative tail protein n=1 Tax=viral metagenome TaxID=1070528 RepID=A0A6M3KNH7_9ZZZZ